MGEERERRILGAAVEVFLRYGYARTTMGDIAEAAGMSRPALYLSFANKEEIFSAVVAGSVEKLARIRAELGEHATVRARLGHACERWVVKNYALVAAQPDARDLFDLHRFEAVRRTYEDFADLLAEILRTAPNVDAAGATPEELARTLVFATRGLQDVARDVDELRRRLDVLLDLTVAAVGDVAPADA